MLYIYFLLDMRRDVQEIFRNTPHEKQVMMFSATLSKEIRPVCKKFMQDVITPFNTWHHCTKPIGGVHRCCNVSGRRVALEPQGDDAVITADAIMTIPFQPFHSQRLAGGGG